MVAATSPNGTLNQKMIDQWKCSVRMLEQKEMSVGSVYGGATMDDSQELLNTARHHCQAIQTVIVTSELGQGSIFTLCLPGGAEY
jgi:hypothetical protein